MAKPDKEIQNKIFNLAIDTLDSMITLGVSVRIQSYVMDDKTRNFREFESELAQQEGTGPIQGIGLLALREDMVKELPSYEQGIVFKEVPLAVDDLTPMLSGFPLDAAAASYAYTMLEVFGDEASALVHPGSLKGYDSWHKDIYGDMNVKDLQRLTATRKAFCKHFNADPEDVDYGTVKKMIRIKNERNMFAHKGHADVNFERFLEDVMTVVCHLTFLLTDEDRISVYPWEDYEDTFSPTSQEQ